MAKKTYKTNKPFRQIGNQKYKNDERPGARPPDAWQDLSLSRAALAPRRHALRMKELGHTKDATAKRLEIKWHLTASAARDIVSEVWK